MPNKSKSPYASSFKSAIKRGTSASNAVKTIAKRHNTTPNVVFNSLHKAGICHRQKFNGTWIYWPCEGIKTSTSSAKSCQTETWQSLVDWCIVSGNCSPQRLADNTGSQKDFMSYCRRYFSQQAGSSSGKGSSKGGSKSSSKRSSSPKRSSASRSAKRTVSSRSSSSRRRYRQAA
jgi:hypothetical protein